MRELFDWKVRLFFVAFLGMGLGAESVWAQSSLSPLEQARTPRFSGELGEQVDQLRAVWSHLGRSRVLAPRLLQREEQFAIRLPDVAIDEKTLACATVVLLGTTNVNFILVFGGQDAQLSDRSWPIPSVAGLIELTRCGERKRELKDLHLEMRSRRGVIETVVLVSKIKPRSAVVILRGRETGEQLASPSIGPRPYLSTLAERIDRKRAAFSEIGESTNLQETIVSDTAGRGSRVFQLGEGCYSFAVLAESSRVAPPDVDAKVIDLQTGSTLDVDEEQSGEAHLIHCSARFERVRVEFNGAVPNTELAVLVNHRPLPNGIPLSWGSDARAALARSLLSVSAAGSTLSDPILASLGIRGVTEWNFEPQPDHCYLLAAAPLRGDSRRISAYVKYGLSERRSESLAVDAGVSLAFCSLGEAGTKLGVRSVGNSVAWVMGLWDLTESHSRLGP